MFGLMIIIFLRSEDGVISLGMQISSEYSLDVLGIYFDQPISK